MIRHNKTQDHIQSCFLSRNVAEIVDDIFYVYLLVYTENTFMHNGKMQLKGFGCPFFRASITITKLGQENGT